MERLENLYFEWLINFVCTPEEIQKYSLLLLELHDFEFVPLVELDGNLVDNCLSMRDRFLGKNDYIMDFPVSILEILVYISVEIEDTLMTNSKYGDRTGLWFWSMIDSLGLIKYDNLRYDEPKIDGILQNFVDRKWKKNGKGGLFTFKNGEEICDKNENIWSIAMRWLSNFAKKDGEIM